MVSIVADPYFDESVRQAVTSENWRIYKAVRSLLEDRLVGLSDDLLDDIEGIDQGFDVPAALLVDDSAEGWIFDSGLDYKEQLALYKEHKAQEDTGQPSGLVGKVAMEHMDVTQREFDDIVEVFQEHGIEAVGDYTRGKGADRAILWSSN